MSTQNMKLADRTIQGNDGYLSKAEVAKLTPALLIERAKALKPLLAADAREAEILRHPTDKVWAALQKAGIFYHFVPKRYGGLEFDCPAYLEIMLPLAEGDASSAWAAGFCVHHNWLMAHFPSKAQEEMFAKGYGLAPGVVSPPAKAIPVEGGYRVTGRWKWGSGVMNADWILGACMVEGEAAPPDLLWMAIPANEVTVPDNWHMTGMAATGSADIIVDDVFVPAYRSVRQSDMRGGTSIGAKENGSLLYKMPMSLFLCMAAAIPALGATRGAVENFRDYLSKRIVFGTANTNYTEKPIGQMRLAEAELKAQTATMLLRDAAQKCMEFAKISPAPDALRIATRGQISFAVKLCVEACRTMCEGMGSSAYTLDSPVQRAWRDTQVIASHVTFDWDASVELLGRSMLGLPPSSPLY